MTPNEQGRHCDLCCHTVIDFSTWALPDIATYLESRKGEKVCGRFNSTQLNKPFDLKTFVPEIISWNTSVIRKIAALIVVCFALGSASCSSESDKAAPALLGDTVMVEQVVPPPDTSKYADLKPVRRMQSITCGPQVVVAGGEPSHPMGGAPVMVYPPDYISPPPVKYQPKIGPPEEDTLITIQQPDE
ncbi:MAG: hypothetical protein EOP49_50315 [Sphingobacteriales bacterium]|nr:MAG: hypothetical protein EOP49_50315 [Sphingobacteriales bacterium]